jgi:hypothetical protein
MKNKVMLLLLANVLVFAACAPKETIVKSYVGKDGINGADGKNGTNGADGKNGTNGIDGTNGTDATPIQFITFCPGTAVYPSTFLEFGMRQGTNVYAVYSDRGGFLTLLLPGNYTSDAINSRCNFTVNADGTVSPL